MSALCRAGNYRESPPSQSLANVSPMHPATGGPLLFDVHSPALTIERLSQRQLASLPRIALVHGTADETVPLSSSRRFKRSSMTAGAICDLHIIPRMDHATWLVEVMQCKHDGIGKRVLVFICDALGLKNNM